MDAPETAQGVGLHRGAAAAGVGGDAAGVAVADAGVGGVLPALLMVHPGCSRGDLLRAHEGAAACCCCCLLSC